MAAQIRPTVPKRLSRLVRALARDGIRFVVTGEFGSFDWKAKLRRTEPIELVVAKRSFREAIGLVQRLYPKLEMRGFVWEVWFHDDERQLPLIHVTEPMGRLSMMYFRHSTHNSIGCRVPTLEMALVEKYAGIIEMDPDETKCRNDIADFAEILERYGSALNWRKVRRLAGRLMIDGGKHIREWARDALAGRVLRPDIQTN